MIVHFIIQFIFALVGIITLTATVADCEWFFTSRNLQPVVKLIGRKRTRILYGIIGFLLITASLYFFIEIKLVK